MKHLVVEAKSVAASLVDLEIYLEKQAKNGWRLVTVDHGVIYMEKDDDEVRTR